MTHGSLFSGIGGFDLAAEWMGWENVFHCEWNDFGQKVLHHYWPKAISYHDITKTDFTIHRGTIDILTGGFPCQPYSMAGKRKGKEDERHLWPEMLRAIKEIQPRWVVGENVYGLVNWSNGLVFHEVQADLEAAGYEVFPYVLPAVSVNAPHRRDRIFFVAYAESSRGSRGGNSGDSGESVCEKERFGLWNQFDNDGEHGTAPNPNSERFGQEHQFCTGRDMFESSAEKTGTTPHPNGFRLEQCENGTKMGGGQTEVGRQGSESTNAIETDGTIPNVTHPNRNGFNGSNCQHEIQPSEGGEYALGDFEQIAINTECIGWVEERNDNGFIKTPQQAECREQQFSRADSAQDWWRNFPTQSPICTGDDGLSSRLDNITFSKWRNESIKAAGNAIVPQVALQIFKTIQQYETTPPLEDTL